MNQKNIPLYEVLQQFHIDEKISFHVPGHKNGLLLEQYIPSSTNFLKLDMTELNGLDDLHDPSGPIKDAQKLLELLYQTSKSYFLVNGSTVGNLAMILSSFQSGDYVLVQRNSHKSILHALELANVHPVFLPTAVDENSGVGSAVCSTIVDNALALYPQIKGCILTYPNYYGHTYDITSIIESIHRIGGIVLVDEAHGAHFTLGYPFPTSSLALGADIVVQSAHKMLPAMTMGSYLHVGKQSKINIQQLEYYLGMLQSSSPSYPIMASLDIARHYLANLTNEDIAYTLSYRQKLKDGISMIPSLQVVETTGQDPLKLLVRSKKISGYTLQNELASVDIFVEMADTHQVVFVLPLLKVNMLNNEKQVLACIEKAVLTAGNSESPLSSENFVHAQDVTELAFTYIEMRDLEVEWVSLSQAVDRVAAGSVIPYPPGIPYILRGERLTKQHLRDVTKLIKEEIKCQGNGLLKEQQQLLVFKEK